MEEKSLIPLEKEKKLAEQGAQLLSEFKDLKEVIITSQQEYDNNLMVSKKVCKALDEFEADRKEITGPLNKQIDDINAKYKPVTSVLKSAKEILKNSLAAWDDKQERLRIQADAEAQAEATRIRESASKKAEQATQKAEGYFSQSRDDKAQEWLGKAQAAEDVANSTVAPTFENEARGKGASFKIEYDVTIQDAHKAINALNTDDYRHMIKIDTGAVGKLAKALNGKLVLEGFIITQKKKVTIRTK